MRNNLLNLLCSLKKIVYHLISKMKYSINFLQKEWKQQKNCAKVLILKIKDNVTRITIQYKQIGSKKKNKKQTALQ